MIHYQYTLTLYLKGASAPFHASHGWIADIRRAKAFLTRKIAFYGAFSGCLIIHGKYSLRCYDGEFIKVSE